MRELSDWTCEFGGLVIGRPGSPVSLVAVDGLLTLPDIRSSDLALVQRHGLWAGDDYMGGRTVTLTLEVYGRTDDEFARAITQVQAAFAPAMPEARFRFRFPGAAGGRTAFINARTRKRSGPLDLNFAYRVCNIIVELFATDPVIRSEQDREVKVTSAAGSAAAPVVRFTQRGSRVLLPRITVTNAVRPSLENVVTGERFAVDYTGSLVIDSAYNRVYSVGGNVDLAAKVSSDSVWPLYGPGTHFVRLTSTDTAKPAVARWSWADEWV
ncbi:hypothetical protein [Streptomyces sp. NPDC001404]|uniref:hypothetical protein n=1 Tax=Streptomyces sp. NPDC001404 TaxID=3364571 RepID=UPI00369076AC